MIMSSTSKSMAGGKRCGAPHLFPPAMDFDVEDMIMKLCPHIKTTTHMVIYRGVCAAGGEVDTLL